jgi:hypothetical protein
MSASRPGVVRSGPHSRARCWIIGHDVILKDATQNLPDSNFGVWAIELPRVYADPVVGPAEDGALYSGSCWGPGYVEPLYDDKGYVMPLYNDKGKVNPNAQYYMKSSSGRCVLLDPFTVDDFTTMSFATRFHALLAERALAVGL